MTGAHGSLIPRLTRRRLKVRFYNPNNTGDAGWIASEEENVVSDPSQSEDCILQSHVHGREIASAVEETEDPN
jgi:hypothetical protein